MEDVRRILQQIDPALPLPNISPINLIQQHTRNVAATAAAAAASPPSQPSPPTASPPSRPLRLLIIDNFDSFTHSLASAFHTLTTLPPLVLYNTLPPPLLLALLPHVDAVVISPGPGHPANPADIGCSALLLPSQRVVDGMPPVLGVCLGLQALVVGCGGRVVGGGRVMHGEPSLVYHDNSALYTNIPSPFTAIRYNSLLASTDLSTFPSHSLTVDSCTADGEVMGVRDRTGRVHTVQFHPESVCTFHGQQLLRNWLTIVQSVVGGGRGKVAADGNGKGEVCDVAIPSVYWSSLPSTRPCWHSSLWLPPPRASLSLSPSLAHLSLVHGLRKQRHFRVLSRELPYVSSENVFMALFAASTSARWWLDSSKLDQRNRYSFMGDASGPHSATIAYNRHNRTLHITSPTSPHTHTHTLPPTTTLLTLMQSHLASHQCSPPSLADSGGADQLPFYGGWVGYLSYEMREEWQPKESGGVEERGVGVGGEGGSSGEERGGGRAVGAEMHSESDAAWVWADRLVVFDHREHKAWALAMYELHDNDNGNELTMQVAEEKQREHSEEKEEKGAQHIRGGKQDAQDWLDSVHSQLLQLAPPVTPLPSTAAAAGELQWKWRWNKDEYLALIRQCKREIAAGESYELCLTNQLYCHDRIDPLLYYRHLRRLNPAPHAAFLAFPPTTASSTVHAHTGPVSIVCSSPERFLSITADGLCECRPIKGTHPLTSSPESLQASTKDFAENLMIVDLIRSDLARVAPSTPVTTTALMAVETYATLHTLVTTVHARLDSDSGSGAARAVGALGVLGSVFPPGSMTGAPKVRSCRLLAGLEGGRRGVYSGCVGWVGVGGGLDMNVVIRTAVVSERGVSIGVGGAIVNGSVEEEEWAEIELKAQALKEAAKHARVLQRPTNST